MTRHSTSRGCSPPLPWHGCTLLHVPLRCNHPRERIVLALVALTFNCRRHRVPARWNLTPFLLLRPCLFFPASREDSTELRRPTTQSGTTRLQVWAGNEDPIGCICIFGAPRILKVDLDHDGGRELACSGEAEKPGIKSQQLCSSSSSPLPPPPRCSWAVSAIRQCCISPRPTTKTHKAQHLSTAHSAHIPRNQSGANPAESGRCPPRSARRQSRRRSHPSPPRYRHGGPKAPAKPKKLSLFALVMKMK